MGEHWQQAPSHYSHSQYTTPFSIRSVNGWTWSTISFTSGKQLKLTTTTATGTPKKRRHITIPNFETSKPKPPQLLFLTEMEQQQQQNQTTEETQQQQPMSKNAKKKLLKQQKWEAKKAEKKALIKQQKREEDERKRQEWDNTLAGLSEDERLKLIESRKSVRKERMEKRAQEKEVKINKLTKAKEVGQSVVIDLDFSQLMASNEIHSLVQQIMYCYSVNAKCSVPAHLWLTGYGGDMATELHRIPGFDNWIIDKDTRPYIDVLQDRKDDLVYLTADAETVLDDLDPAKVYIIGGIVDRNRCKGITLDKAVKQGIQTAKLPIGNFLKMSSSQVLTVNQVVELLLVFLETRDWKTSFFQVIPQRKRCGDDGQEHHEDLAHHEEADDQTESKKQCVGGSLND